MELIKKSILLISPESWGPIRISKHHFAMELSKRKNGVYFLNPPSQDNSITKISENLFLVNYKPRFRGLGKLPGFISAYLIKMEIRRLEKLTKKPFDVIWNFDSSRFFNLKLLRTKLKIAHLVDYYENFNRDLLSKTSDLCLCTSQHIGEEMKKYNANVFNIGHGYNSFNSELSDIDLKELKNDSAKIKACYVGNLNIKYLDWYSILDIVKNSPEVEFYFIGPEGKSNVSRSETVDRYMLQVKESANTVFLGPKSAEKIISYLKTMDVLLMVYKAKEYEEQLSNPHKMLEYLGSGKVVVSSWTDEYKDKTHLLEMVKSNEELPSKFKEVISNLDHYNSQDKQAQRISFALANTYENKIKLIEKLIDEYVAK